MAGTANSLLRQARQLSPRLQWSAPRMGSRQFTRTATRADGKDDAHFDHQIYASLARSDQTQYDQADTDKRKAIEHTYRQLQEESQDDSPTNRELESMIKRYVDELKSDHKPPHPPRRIRPGSNPGLFARKTEQEYLGPDADFQQDDISSTAHGELEQHRELREIARVTAWEMPLLADLQIPFRKPDSKKRPLRFRYTTYLGEHHAASKKVVVEFKTHNLGLSPPQEVKLVKLAGPRYDPHRRLIRMSSESFETQAQNKRYLGETVAELLRVARDQEADSFADIPLDFRHAKTKTMTPFPREWIANQKRLEQLHAARLALDQLDRARLVDGVEAIEQRRRLDAQPVPVLATTSKATTGRKALPN